MAHSDTTAKGIRTVLFGDTGRFSLRRHSIIGASLFASVGLAIGGVGNALLGMDAVAVSCTFVLGLLFFLYYYLARFQGIYRPLFWPMVLSGCLLIAFLWIYNAGLKGPAPVWAPIIIGVTMLIGRGRQRYAAICLVAVVVCALIGIQVRYPDISIAYTSDVNWAIDSVATFVIAAMIVSLMIRFLLYSYRVEKDRVEKGYALLEETNDRLTRSLLEIKTLSGLLPICAACKKARDDQGYWKQIEEYIQTHSEASVSHGICPDCAKRLYPDLDINDDRATLS